MLRKSILAALIPALLFAPQFAAAKTQAKSSGTLAIVFKDGHRQVFNLSDIERVEFPAPAAAASTESAPSGTQLPPRGRFVGKWEVGDGYGHNFFINLSENSDAYCSLDKRHGKWAYVNGQAQITWDDGTMDAIRRVGSRFQKAAFAAGKSFTDRPDNVAEAHNTSPRPI